MATHSFGYRDAIGVGAAAGKVSEPTAITSCFVCRRSGIATAEDPGKTFLYVECGELEATEQ